MFLCVCFFPSGIRYLRLVGGGDERCDRYCAQKLLDGVVHTVKNLKQISDWRAHSSYHLLTAVPKHGDENTKQLSSLKGMSNMANIHSKLRGHFCLAKKKNLPNIAHPLHVQLSLKTYQAVLFCNHPLILQSVGRYVIMGIWVSLSSSFISC